MDKADEYLRDAAECIHLAARQTSIEHKARLLQMAEAWIYLAYRPRRKRPVRSPQIPSLKTADRNKQQGIGGATGGSAGSANPRRPAA